MNLRDSGESSQSVSDPGETSPILGPEGELEPRRRGDFLLWLCASAFFTYDIFARLQLIVILLELLVNFETDPATVGTLFGSAWFWAYALLQIPVGWFFDTIRPYRVVALFSGLSKKLE
mmetsp:Transcript_14532/g.36902  ORF Transcript_14532/g.36902 Transcript_14532/m.36902 type:complete len:119 (-) Transcript_14532:25-381(-)